MDNTIIWGDFAPVVRSKIERGLWCDLEIEERVDGRTDDFVFGPIFDEIFCLRLVS